MIARHLRGPWPAWTVQIPAILAIVVAAALGSVGWWLAGFGVLSSCTDHFSCVIDTCAPCATAGRWIDAGAIGQGILLTGGCALLALGMKRPRWRPVLVVASVAIVPTSIAWIDISSNIALRSF